MNITIHTDTETHRHSAGYDNISCIMASNSSYNIRWSRIKYELYARLQPTQIWINGSESVVAACCWYTPKM